MEHQVKQVEMVEQAVGVEQVDGAEQVDGEDLMVLKVQVFYLFINSNI